MTHKLYAHIHIIVDRSRYKEENGQRRYHVEMLISTPKGEKVFGHRYLNSSALREIHSEMEVEVINA